MLYNLHVKNLALIDEQEIEFEDGLNILTGETGAGKSVIIGSVNLALGAKADKDMIRTGCDYALIEMTFGLPAEQVQAVKDLELPVEEDNTVLIQRKIMPGRSISKVGGETVTTKQLKDLSNLLINIHGQNDHQALLHKTKQLEILDDYAGEQLEELKTQLRECHHHHQELQREYDSMDLDEKTRQREQELIEFEVHEIDEAAPVEGEDEKLESDYRRMANSRKITESVGEAAEILSGESEEENASDAVSRALREINSVSGYDAKVEELGKQLSEVDSLMSDFCRALSEYMNDMEFDEEDFRHTEDRLNLINHLKDKYGATITKILEYHDEQQRRLETLQDLDAHRIRVQKELEKTTGRALELCGKISQQRKSSADALAQKMKKALIDLNFLDVRFEIQVRPDEAHISANGYDDVEFMISTNPGESIRPLEQIASGGELSRIMLALKTVLADKDEIGTLIFDEIDTGISGRTAWKVSEKLGVLAKGHQIICITHLPQIAAMADNHFLIEKGLEKDRTITRIRKLQEEESIRELGRLLGGAEITDAVTENAREMRRMAKQTKA